ncbi:MAG: beta-lactamase family protein [Anaerolineae bacterium]|nr:beta-lactamase family protein [Anaerolineae bacterium]
MLNQLSARANQRLDALMGRDLGNVFPACSLTVIYKGETVLDAAWGEVEGNPTQVDTRFDLASVTKLFTATAFLSLVSAGNVRLDDPLVSVIPEFGAESPRRIEGGQDPHSKERLATPAHLEGQTVDPALVTFRHLLTHTSGLPAWRDVYTTAGSAPTPPDRPDPISRGERWARAVKALCGYPFTGKPGKNVSYSDVGLMLLGEALARLHGASLDEAILARVLRPLGLNNVLFNPVREGGIPRENIAPTEDDPTWRKRRAWGEVHDENACGVGGVAGHAGLFAPARSVALLGRAWLYEPHVFGIDPELAALAKQEQSETDGARRGLGFALKAHVGASAGDYFSPNTYGHTGFTGTSLWIDPDKELIVACLTNSVYPGRWHGGTLEFRRDLHDLLAQELEAS